MAFLLGLLLGVGFGTLSGGAAEAPEEAPGLAFSGGVQFLPRMRGEEDSRLEVNSVYDQHTWLYANQLAMLPGAGNHRRMISCRGSWS